MPHSLAIHSLAAPSVARQSFRQHVVETHRNAVAGPSRYVPPTGGRSGETVLGLTSGQAAYHLFIDSLSGKVTTDLGVNGKPMERPRGRRALLVEEGAALRPALERLASRTDALLNSPLHGW